jgi:superfamily II DNA or RNA helicase/diadenosine tetraphosphate (Ap4A) HIT family hydrolase
MTDCPFCVAPADSWFYRDHFVRAIWDKHPVTPGHALIVPIRHVATWFDASNEELIALVRAVADVRLEIERVHKPDGYNLGVNVGAAGGQTVDHLHLHVIPRYAGDAVDPRGGIRHVIAGKGNYLDLIDRGDLPHARPLVRGVTDPLLPHLLAHLDAASDVDIAVAFTMDSGVRLIDEHLRDVVARGGRVRFLTGDYLNVTEPDALLRLLDLGERAEIRVFESGNVSFHPKSYILRGDTKGGIAFVGSSNLSRTALKEGVEWNYRVITSRDASGFDEVSDAFEKLFEHPNSRPIDAAWVEAYRRRRHPIVPELTGVQPEPVPPPPPPHDVQVEALQRLAVTRAEGNVAGLVVLATGLGKTWLSAFDTRQAAAERVLFVAHRDEILEQALRTYRTIRPHVALGKYTGTEKVADADVVFASIQTLGRQHHLDRFAPDHFDYIVVDEFHHAAASTYRRLIEYFTPRFLLGLTATPERTDGGDLLSLCGENLVYRCDLIEGIRRGLLCPFDYYGVPDEVDYENIPWRSNRFDEEALTTAVATRSRAENALDQLRRRGGTRTLAFCVSQRHADFMKRFFLEVGLRAAAVHAGVTSDPRARSLERLQQGEIDVLFAVDMFNEGLDLPDVDTVLMLRPTESRILWLQQFGRGLRVRPGKRLKVIDYIGNHRSFLLKPRALFQLGGGDADISYALRLIDEGRGAELLPPGCSVTYELEAKDMLLSLLHPPERGEALAAYYREFRERTGVRPTATETFHGGLDPKSARPGYGSWFQFVRAMGDLESAADTAETRLRRFLSELEVTPMTKSFKMLMLLAMIAEDAFPEGLPLDRLQHRVRELARRSSVLRTELGDAFEDEQLLADLLIKNPIAAWVGGRGTGGELYFKYEGGRFAATFTITKDLRDAATSLVRELADWRLTVYLRRTGDVEGAPRIYCRVSHTNGKPIIFLPPRERTPGIPEGWVDVIADGDLYHAKFVKIAVNVATRGDSEINELPALLHKWFGPRAGQPGTSHAVVFERTDEGYSLAPAAESTEQGPRLWAIYKRSDIPKLFGIELKGFEAQQGIVTRPGIALLFVTLEKAEMQKEHRYEDAFVSATEFRWQTQNRTKRDSPAGRAIANHKAENTAVHLFVRAAPKVAGKTQPFVYCGQLSFERWEGDNPITVWWRLSAGVPPELHALLRVPS